MLSIGRETQEGIAFAMEGVAQSGTAINDALDGPAEGSCIIPFRDGRARREGRGEPGEQAGADCRVQQERGVQGVPAEHAGRRAGD